MKFANDFFCRDAIAQEILLKPIEFSLFHLFILMKDEEDERGNDRFLRYLPQNYDRRFLNPLS